MRGRPATGLVLLRQPPATASTPGAAPIVMAFADCRHRATHCTPQKWRQRAVADWVEYLEGNLTEEADRRAGTRPDTEQRTHNARRSVGARPCFDLAECVGHFEIPPLIWRSTYIESLRRRTIDSAILINDFCARL
ncbi:terpene synthase family protein [Streptomyces sp. TLI_185]|uniref:terpene synthase family protein n=1 Tax=Streptomyces sp. TLI_185 TaxID=2485151 RepID=UPI000F4EB65A|nr:terpene synthase family protein [Streptomyces sp. TLI_185]